MDFYKQSKQVSQPPVVIPPVVERSVVDNNYIIIMQAYIPKSIITLYMPIVRHEFI